MSRAKGTRNKIHKKYTCGIYQIRNTENGKRYIGSSRKIEDRWNKHKWMLRKGIHHKNKTGQVSHLQHAWNQYSEYAFAFEVLEECHEDHLIERETFYFNQVDASERYNGAHITPTTLGHKHSPETRKLMSRKASVPKPHKRRAVRQLDLEGNLLASYKSIREAACQLGLAETNISACCRGVTLTCAGYYWQYENEPKELKEPGSKFKPKCQYDDKGKLLHTYNSVEEIEAAGFTPSLIRGCCLGLRRMHANYYWAEEGSQPVIVKRRTKFKPREKYSKAGELLKTYHSIDELKRAGFNPDGVTRCCRGDRPTYKGFIWKYGV